MTSLPIMFWALYDFEFVKDIQFGKPESQCLMKNPFLYKAGMESRLYGIKQFIIWVAYSMIHAYMIYLTNFVAFSQIHAYLGANG